MNKQVAEMNYLYNASVVEREFSTERLLQCLKEEHMYPIEGMIKQYERYEHMIKESESIEEVFFILSGCIIASKGKMRTPYLYGSQDIIGLENLTMESQSSYSFEVISDKVKVMKYKKEDVIKKLFNTQEGYLYHYVYMQDRFKQIVRREQLLRLNAEERVGSALIILSERYGERIVSSTIFRFPKSINKGLLARYTNLNPNTITNVLQKLHQENILSRNQKGLYVDISILKAKIAHMF